MTILHTSLLAILLVFVCVSYAQTDYDNSMEVNQSGSCTTSINGQDFDLRCEDIDWKEAVHYLENQCPQFELYRLKRYK